MISVLLLPLGKKRIYLHPICKVFDQEKSLSKWRAETVGLQLYQGCNHQEYRQEIHFAFQWALESKPHHLTLTVICGFCYTVALQTYCLATLHIATRKRQQ